MNETTIRQHMEELRARLRTIDSEREVVLTLLKGYEGWLRLFSEKPSQLPLNGQGPTQILTGPISIRGAVRQVLMDAGGESLHCAEIWRRAEALGATTTVDDPVRMVDYTAYGIKGLKKAGKRAWQWVGGDFRQGQKRNRAKARAG